MTTNAPARSIRATPRLVSLRQTRTSIGSSDTDEKELTVRPCMLPSWEATVTTVTPVGNEPIALRKALTSTVGMTYEEGGRRGVIQRIDSYQTGPGAL